MRSPVVTVHQSSFIPWIGYWNKILKADILVDLRATAFSKAEYYHRVKSEGSWITLPVAGAKGLNIPLRNVTIAKNTILPKIVKRLKQTLLPRKYGEKLLPLISIIERGNYTTLVELNTALLVEVLRVLDRSVRIIPHIIPSDLTRTKTQGLQSYVEHAGPAVNGYLMGPSGADYFCPSEFTLDIPVYHQVLKPWVADETILHLIANTYDAVPVIMEAATWELI